MVIASLVLPVLSACAGLGVTPAPVASAPPTPTVDRGDPQGTAAAFLGAWERGDYPGMYSLLSPLSRDSISLAEFQARYEAVMATATARSVQARILSLLKEGETAHASYEVTLHTRLVGAILRDARMQLVFTGGRWVVAWTDGLILPELEGGQTLLMNPVIPARANIYDREGRGLAVQGEAVAIGITPGEMTDEGAVLAALSSLLGLRPDAIQQKYANARPDWYVPIGQAAAEDVQANYATLASLAGVTLSRYSTRFYPFGGVAPQVVGYLGAISPEALAEYQARGYTGDERVGVAGLEAWAEPYLSGVRGGRLSVVTADGQVQPLAESQSQPAQAVYTTLDRTLQIAARQALGEFRGAAIVLNPQTGEVLAMASNPAFDPNLFDPTNRNSRDGTALAALLAEAGKPLLNRAAQGQYPPGSVFKIPMMAAGLMSGLFERDTSYVCTGRWDTLGPNAVKYDWTVALGVKPHGKVDFVQALAYSCDPYFYTVAYDLYGYQADYAAQVARQFGFGAFTNVGQAAEAQGLIPDPAWKKRVVGEDWTAGDSVNMGIGQGYVLATPLQVAQMMAAVRNGGTLYRPQLVHHIAPPGGEPSYQLEPVVAGQLPVSAEQLALIQEALRAVTAPGGTAHHRFLNPVAPVAGKTGTAEDPAGGAPHAWFAGYTEGQRADKPDVVIVVVVENQGEGSEYAAPIFRRIMEVYFTGSPATLYPWETEFGATGTPAPGSLTPAPGITPSP